VGEWWKVFLEKAGDNAGVSKQDVEVVNQLSLGLSAEA